MHQPFAAAVLLVAALTPGLTSATPQQVKIDKVFAYAWGQGTGDRRETFSFVPPGDLDVASILSANVSLSGEFEGSLLRKPGSGTNNINVSPTLTAQLTQPQFGQLRLRDEQRKQLGTTPVDLQLTVGGSKAFHPRLGPYDLLTIIGGIPESSTKAVGDVRIALANTLTVEAPASQSAPRPGVLQQLGKGREYLRERLFYFFNIDIRDRPSQAPSYIDRKSEAVDLLRNDLQANTAPSFGTVGMWLQSASPASFAHSLAGAAEPVRVQFDLSILDPNTTFSVLLGGFTVYRTESFDSGVDHRRIDLTLLPFDDTEITFLVDSTAAGSSAVVSNVSVGGLDLEQDGWYTKDHGPATWVYSVTNTQVGMINAVTAVPEPATLAMTLGGLALIGAFALRHRSSSSGIGQGGGHSRSLHA